MELVWNKRYSMDEYVYGIHPNEFFREKINNLSIGRILLPAEGEGRNAVYSASLGWDVTAFDYSEEGRKKAMLLAKDRNVELNYDLHSIEYADYTSDYFDVIALIYAHNIENSSIHKKMIDFLKPGGKIILEGFSKKQIENNSGGPKNIKMLFSKDELMNDFKCFNTLEVWEEEIELNEGEFHKGKASVVRLYGEK